VAILNVNLAMRKAGFWLAVACFQLMFGLIVFFATRQYYLAEAEPLRTETTTVAPDFPPAFLNAVSALPDIESSIDPQPPEQMAARADEQFRSGSYAEAAVLYQRLVELDSTNVNLLNNLAITLHYIGRSDEALDRMETALAIDENHQRAWLTLGFVHSQLGNSEEARTALNRAIELGPDNEVGDSAARMLSELE
jgi:tetratricopeptide (TPR) repeat protein